MDNPTGSAAYVFRFSLALLLMGAGVALAQTSSPQAPVTQERLAALPNPIAPGQNSSAIHALPAEGTGGETSGDPVVTQTTLTPSPASGDSRFEILIGPGDLIEVSVYGAPDYIKTVRVGSTGEITLPLAGTVKVSGLTPVQAEALIAKRLNDGNFFNDPRVSVLEKEFVTQGISVLGEVQKPGVYQMPGPRKLLDAISTAGGTTPRAGNTVTLLHRSNSERPDTVTISYDGKPSSQSNIYVYPGDTVVVSKAGVVYVVGDVRLPGGFIMENSRMTLLQAFSMAQGASPNAALDKTELIRKEGPESGPQATIIPLKKILTAQLSDINLQPGDIIFVPTSIPKAAARRTLEAIVQTASGMAIYSRIP